MIAARGYRHGYVAAGERAQIVHQGGQVVACFEEHEPAFGAQRRRGL